MFVIFVVLFIFAGLAFYFYRRSVALESQKQLPPGFQSAGEFTPASALSSEAEGSLASLKIGDIVSYFDQDFVVEGKIDYNEDGWPWTCFMLVDGKNVRWLAIEEDDQLDVSLWEKIDLDLGQSPPEFIDYEGERFRLVEHGSARVAQTGQTGRRTGLNMEYFEYEGTSERGLSVEKWGREIEVSIGQSINPYSLEILPGGGTSFT